MLSQLNPEGWGELIGFIGIPAAVLFAVLWYLRSWLQHQMETAANREQAYMLQSQSREERYAERMDRMEQFQSTVLVDLIAECKGALAKNTEVIGDLHRSVLNSNDSVRELITRMIERPCLLPNENDRTAADKLRE